MSDSFHTGAWVAWLAAAALPAFTVRNPLYLVLILGAAGIVFAALGRRSVAGQAWGGFVRVGLFFVGVAVVFNALSVHTGDLVLVRLPERWPIVGGPITGEAMIAGAVNGLGLLTILVVFATFNAVVDHYQLLRATPAFLFQAGVVLSIAITFVPQMVLSAREIREAQRIRGHRFRGVRDLLPLVMPLLASSLERAIRLAETMEARGFGGAVEAASRRAAIGAQIGILGALLALLAGLGLAAYRPSLAHWGWLLAGSGVLLLGLVFYLQGRRVRQTRYRRQPWQVRDVAVLIASAAVVAAVVFTRLEAPGVLVYSPYPPGLLLPPFEPVTGAALVLLAMPALAGNSSHDGPAAHGGAA
ncbi:MAG: energy-coupling factor transporter transmembrane protein EcfT [Anaerolineae bacterium]|nr:energy-coupling factor transporter transmembrane protein EcfT [Anaerolineae bacterium]